MTQHEPPLLLEPDALKSLLDSPETGPRIVIIDLCKPTAYAQAHIPGAIHLDYPQIVAVNNPVMGLLPEKETLNQLFSRIGLTNNSHIVAYDDEGGGRAARLIWTLDAIGHKHASLLNGGLHAWIKEGHPYVNTEKRHETSHYDITINEKPENDPVANREYILSNLKNGNVLLLDSRSPEEYRGEKKFAARAGRIPGAINLDWFLLIDKEKNMRLKPEDELRALLKKRGVSEDKTIVAYCQTHHRSALTYFVLKLLGFKNIKGYHGSWSDWGNQENTPVETG